jgi:ureidoglycolate hydrolase
MSDGARQVTGERLSEASWAPFGWLPVGETDPRDGQHRLDFAWNDVHLNIIGHTRDEVPEIPGGLRCEVLYRHDTHTQALMVLNTTAIIAVAPAAVDLSAQGATGEVRAFILEPLDALVLHRGTWHWGPFPTVSPEVRLLNVQGLGYREDNASVDLAALGSSVDILLG